ncbi:MAG: SDR family oxidoreductase [Myxococcales bacterium]
MSRVFISGASQGLGLELARQYASNGWEVLATFRDAEGERRLAALGAAVSPVRLDVTDAEATVQLGKQLAGTPIDVLIANAGMSGTAVEPTRASVSSWLQVFQVNSIAPVLLAQALLESVAASAQKKLVAISSKLGSIGSNDSGGKVAYRASKAALNSAWKSLAVELAPRGITAVVLHPGWVQTRMGGAGAPLSPEASAAQMRATIASVDFARSGAFLLYDGSSIPW